MQATASTPSPDIRALGMQIMSKHKYIFKPWVATYSLIIGILQILGMNLAGILWIYWWHKMKEDKSYQPKWLYWIHILYVVTALSLFIMAFTPLNRNIKLKYFGHVIENPSIPLVFCALVFFLVIFGLPFIGIKREKIPN